MSTLTSFYPLKIKDIRRETPECVSIAFEIPEELKDTFFYKAGQYLTLRTQINEEEVRRSYSICSAPSEGELRVAVKYVEKGKFSGFANQILKVDDLIDVMPPLGKFMPLEKEVNEGKNYLAFVAGSGITPIMSLAKTILEENETNTFHLFYGNKSHNSIIFKESLDALKNKYMDRLALHHVFTRETLDAPLFNGRIDVNKVEQFCQSLISLEDIDEIFICGPESMILSLRQFFVETKGFPSKHVHMELFSSPDEPKTIHRDYENKTQKLDSGKISKVTVILDGREHELEIPYDGESILDAGLMAGLDLPYACKGGVCCTCRAKIEDGEVEMEVNYALEDDEVENGFVLTCQSHPRMEHVTVNYDEI